MRHLFAISVALLVASSIKDPNVWWIMGFVVFAEIGWWQEEHKIKLLKDKERLIG